jgi:hypothetical protein
MLRDVKHIIRDGLLGFSTPTGDGLSVKIGASPVVSGAPVIITGDMDASKIRQRLTTTRSSTPRMKRANRATPPTRTGVPETMRVLRPMKTIAITLTTRKSPTLRPVRPLS